MDDNLLIEQNSGFKRNDSTVNQLLKIVHQIYQDINNGKDTFLVFLDVSFDKVRHKGLLSHDVASGSYITLCNKICKPLVVYRFTGNVMTSITTLRT